MAVGEAKQQAKNWWRITQVSWTDWVTQDVYYWLEHSFQYAENINCDDELHWIKLANKVDFVEHFEKCQLVSCGENWVMALSVDAATTPYIFTPSSFYTGWQQTWDPATKPNPNIHVCPWVVFQDYFWYWADYENTASLIRISNTWAWTAEVIQPFDHSGYMDEDIESPSTKTSEMNWSISAILNYNNSRLVVAVGWGHSKSSIWVYYPELDQGVATGDTYRWATGWKKVLEYEAWVNIVALTCTFEYLKIWTVDEWWNTKIYYYQWNNNLRSTFVYNVIDLTGERVLRAYSLNGTDYYISSIDWTDGYVNLNKLVGVTPVMLFHQRAGLDVLDVNYKAPYFVGPVSINWAYKSGKFYIWDQYGVFQFTQNPQGYDKGYMKWKLRDATTYKEGNEDKEWKVYWLCENQGYLYVSDSRGCYKMRIYDTGVDGFQEKGILISREFEGKEWGTVTKMLDEIRMNFELNPDTNNKWTIDVYVSPNNKRKNTYSFTEANGWYHAMSISKKSGETRVEKSNLFNELGSGSGNTKKSSFRFDWQTITYAIIIQQTTSTHATPIVRQLDIKYHCKDKTNYVYDIN